MDDIHKMYKAALKEIERLKQENYQLKQQMRNHIATNNTVMIKEVRSERETTFGTSRVNRYSSVEDKVALYRQLFRGREDVFPIRWQNKQGKSGYSPACGNEWTTVCQKPKVKCSACIHQAYLPITDEVISNHLDAREDKTIGIYPMQKDETCWFLAMDFDKHNWKEDAKAVMQVCENNDIPAALERSRSGNGGHIWIFFNESIAASEARRLGTIILSLTMDQRYQLGLDSYDRLFPNQDTMPRGGLGNLIALPLQGGPRKKGNSVFIDEEFQPYEDQWSFLYSLHKMTLADLSQFIQTHATEDNLKIRSIYSEISEETANELEPWVRRKTGRSTLLNSDPLPSKVHIVQSDRVYIEKNELPATAINRLMRIASFSNPDFYKTQAMRLSTYGKPRVISCAEELPHHIALPRGCLTEVTDFFEQHGRNAIIEDKRFAGIEINAEFKGELTTMQDVAAKAILAKDIGILSAATGFGKTVVAANIITRRQVNTLILVHRRELMDQWRERLQTFLNMSKESIGLVSGGKDKRTGVVDIAVIQSLNRKGEVKAFVEEYGQIIVDECHHVSAFSFEQVLMKAKAKYVVGLTATPKRQDGHEAIIMMQLGPVRLKVDAKMLTGSRGYAMTVIPRYTTFKMPLDSESPGIQEVYQTLVTDEIRNTMIFNDLLQCMEEGRSPLLLVERTAHAEYFEQRLSHFVKNLIVLRGGMGKKQREAIREKISKFPDNEERVFIATGKLIGEGFDDARLDTLFLVHPISWTGTLQQYAGRLHRNHVNKTEVKIYDYIDLQVPVLMSMYKKRIKGYRKMGYKGAEL